MSVFILFYTIAMPYNNDFLKSLSPVLCPNPETFKKEEFKRRRMAASMPQQRPSVGMTEHGVTIAVGSFELLD